MTIEHFAHHPALQLDHSGEDQVGVLDLQALFAELALLRSIEVIAHGFDRGRAHLVEQLADAHSQLLFVGHAAISAMTDEQDGDRAGGRYGHHDGEQEAQDQGRRTKGKG
ncbi:MAG: hypothetical protein AMXMBFR33_29340 [Candidatus Xenobia bacterium]